MKAVRNAMRFDLRLIASWIEPNSRVLDLGCGEGDLLVFLRDHKQVVGIGIEHSEARAGRCIERGLSVVQGDINEEIRDYPDTSFDYVILSQTLQQVYEPAKLITSLLRVGRRGIVSFPNFSHWGIRAQLLLTGHAPVSRQLPYQWYDTPNIRVITIKDFRKFSRDFGCRIIREAAINTHRKDRQGRMVHHLATWFATYGIFMITAK